MRRGVDRRLDACKRSRRAIEGVNWRRRRRQEPGPERVARGENISAYGSCGSDRVPQRRAVQGVRRLAAWKAACSIVMNGCVPHSTRSARSANACFACSATTCRYADNTLSWADDVRTSFFALLIILRARKFLDDSGDRDRVSAGPWRTRNTVPK